MKDLFEIFDEKIEVMQKLTADLNFRACTSVSTDLITTANMFDYKDGVFIGEVFEAIFEQIWRLTRDYILTEDDQNMLKTKFSKYLAIIANSYKKTDKNELYGALSNLRCEVTKLQFSCEQTMKRKERREPFEPFE